MRDFDWNDTLYAVVKEDGTYAGVPCLTYDEAKELSYQHEGSHIFMLGVPALTPTIKIDLHNGYFLTAEQNMDPFERELFVGITDANGAWINNLAMIRNAFTFSEDGDTVWTEKEFDIWVNDSELCPEDYTHMHYVDLNELINEYEKENAK